MKKEKKEEREEEEGERGGVEAEVAVEIEIVGDRDRSPFDRAAMLHGGR